MSAGLNKRDTLPPLTDRPRGVLHLKPDERIAGHARYRPSADLAFFVDHYWAIEWDLPSPQLRETLPHPAIYLVLEHGRAYVGGVSRERFRRVLEPRGQVFGVRFRPAGFCALTDRCIADFTERTLPLRELFGAAAAPVEAVVGCTEHTEVVDVLETFMRGLRPALSAKARLARDLVDHIVATPGLLRVEQLVRESALSTRGLQRLFHDHIGIGPKWVIQRYRMHEAMERIALDPAPDWPAIALDLGYADQAHFIRDFRRMMGRPPREYARGFDPRAAA